MYQKITRRRFLQQVGLVGGGLVLAACAAPSAQPAASSDSSDEAAALEQFSLEMWGGAFLMNANKSIYDASEFFGANPHLVFEATPASGNLYAQKMKTAIAAGDSKPDILLVHYQYVKDFLLPGISVDISDRVDESGFSPGIFKSAKEEGKTFGIPYETATFVNYYREDVLNDLGLELPTTREEYFAVGDTIKNETGSNWTFVDKASGNQQLFLAIVLMLGGDIFSTDDGSVILDTDAGKGMEAAQLLYDLSNSGFAEPLNHSSPEGFEAVKNSDVVGNLIPYAWVHRMMDALTADDEVFGKWRIGESPTLIPGGTNAISHQGAYLAINALSEHPDEAWQVAEWFGQSVEGVTALAEEFVIIGAYRPGLENVVETSQGWDIFGGQRAQAQMAEIAKQEDLRVITMHPDLAEGQKIIDEALTRMLNDEITPEQAVTESSDKIRAAG